MTQQQKRRMNRRGLVLLIVLGMLGLFSLLAITFMVTSRESVSSARALEKPIQRGTPPNILGDLVIKQIVRGTKDPVSPFYGHDLGQDQYGEQLVLRDLAESNANPTQRYEETVRLRARLDTNARATVVAGSSLITLPLDNTVLGSLTTTPAQYPNGHQAYGLPVNDDYFNGRILTFYEGPLRGTSYHILRWYGQNFNRAAGDNYKALIDLSEPLHYGIANSDSALVSRLLANPTTDLVAAVGTYRVVINAAAYRGSGLGVLYDNNSSQYQVAQRVTRYQPQPANTSNNTISVDPRLPLLGRIGRAMTFLSRNGPSGPGQPDLSVVHGSTAEDYDAADYNDWWLSYRHEPTPNRPSSSHDIIPSYHRPEVVKYLYTQFLANNSANLGDPNTVRQFLSLLEAATLRPLSYKLSMNGGLIAQSNRDFTGSSHIEFDNSSNIISNPQLVIDFSNANNVLTQLNRYIAALVRGPWDVDTDHDNVNDSNWLDPNLPLITAGDGKLIKALFAINIEDMEARLNVNAIGDRLQGRFDTSGNWVFPVQKDSGFSPPAGNVQPPQVLPHQGSGYGPADLSLAHLFNLGTIPGRDACKDIFDLRFGVDQAPGRYGRLDASFFNNRSRALLHNHFKFGASTPVTTASPGLPMNVHGRIAAGVDLLGNARLSSYDINANTDSLTNEIADSNPYRSTGGVSNSAGDSFFSLTELEQLLRKYDADRAESPGRLANLFSQNKTNAAVQNEIHHLLTTHSVDTTMPSLAYGEKGIDQLYMIFERLANQWRVQQNGNATPISKDDLTRIFPAEFRLNKRFDLNMPYGNGLDDDMDGQIDEPSEVWNTTTQTSTETEGDNGASGIAGRYTRDRTNAIDFAEPTATGLNVSAQGPNLSRSLHARYLYCLAQSLVPTAYQFPGMSGNTPKDRAIRARNLAQWAVNVVDYRDTDAAMTRFAYDEDPFDRGLPTEPSVWVPQPGRIVWGLEFPELVFSETLATHDTAVQDTYLDSDKAKTIRDQSDPANVDPNLDQYRVPTGSLYVEVYAPRTTGTASDRYLASVPFAQSNGVNRSLYTVGGNGRTGLNLAQVSPPDNANNIPSMPVWRISISPALKNSSNQPTAFGGDHTTMLTGMRNPAQRWTMQYQLAPVDAPASLHMRTGLSSTFDGTFGAIPRLPIERMIWFSTFDPATVAQFANQGLVPELGLTAGGSVNIADRIFYNRATNTNSFLEGGNYLVIGPRPITSFGSRNPRNSPSDDIFAINAAGQGPIGQLKDLVKNLPSSQRIEFVPGGGVLTYGLDNTSRNQTNIRGASWMIAASDVRSTPATPSTNWIDAFPPQQGLGVNISIPCADQLIVASNGYVKAPNKILNTENGSNFPISGPPFNSWVDLKLPGSDKFPDEPYDIKNPNIELPNDDKAFEGTIRDARVLYLQRLADPERSYDPALNPYITIDVSATDLSIFSGEIVSSNTNPTTYFGTAERTGVEVTNNINNPRTPFSFTTKVLADRTVDHPTRDKAIFGHLLGVSDTANLASPRNILPTFGYLNSSLGLPLPAVTTALDPIAFVGHPQNPMAGLFWLNRDYVTPYELFMVPASSPGQLNQQFTSFLTPPASVYDSVPPNPGAVDGDLHHPFGHLMNFFENSVQGGQVALDFNQLLEFIETPSRFVGVERILPLRTGIANVADRTIADVYRPPYNKLPTYREPGKINLNTVASGYVWKGLEWNYDSDNRNNLGGALWWNQFRYLRQGFQDHPANPLLNNAPGDTNPLQQNPWIRPDIPTQFLGVYRNQRGRTIHAADPNVTEVQNLLRRDIQTTLLRPQVDPTTNQPLGGNPLPFATPTSTASLDPFTKYQALMRVPNLVSSHSNTLVVRMTIGYFEYDPSSGLGIEHVGQNGETKRHRAMYIIDRSIPFGYITGEDLNTDQTILLRRFLE